MLDIWMYMPDGEPVHTAGSIVWVSRNGSRFRMGIELLRVELKPIPIVLRALHLKTHHYG